MNESRNRKIADRIRNIKRYISNKAQFRNNIVTGKLEYKSQTMPDFKEVDDYALNTMSVELAENNIKCSPSELKDILMSRLSPRYNPFTDFMENLPPWDGKTDHIEELASTVETSNQQLWSRAFKKWIVAMVASVLKDEVINHTALILTGTQGFGKSTWLQKLIPEQLQQYCYSGTIRIGDKDTLVLLSEKMLIIIDELAYLNNRQLNELKEIITKKDVQIRRAYGRFTERMPRRASFAGSVNDKELLTDTTGSRRFLCFTLEHQINNNHNVDMNLVYAQALALFKGGFQYWFDLKEIHELNLNNEEFRVRSIEEEYLLLTFERASKDQICKKMAAGEIMTELNRLHKLPISDAAKQRLGKALNVNHFEWTKSNGRKVYFVRFRDQEKEGYLSLIPEIDNKLEFN